MHALLVVNHQATTTSRRSRDVLVRALRSEVTLEVAYTDRRGHATTLARQAAADRIDLVVAHGGDGTVNEVVNGLMPGGAEAGVRPALAVVPGGSTNVFARALGLPREWAEATGVILEALRGTGGRPRTRTVGLGLAAGLAGPAGTGEAGTPEGERYFTFCAGLGVDAAVVRRVEQARRRGRTSTPGLYLRATLNQLLRNREGRRPAITLEGPAGRIERLVTVIIQNTAPWTYLGDRPIDPNPRASFDLGLDVLALRTLQVPGTARTFGQLLVGRRAPRGRQLVRWHDQAELVMHASRPLPFQVDGDYLGEQQKVQLAAVPSALRVVC